ncbi:MAG TPA: TfuA-like protein [Streptosporangiaceae bacterium]|nr:TfuA-like protein [Streptosporangiaceae bacterium]
MNDVYVFLGPTLAEKDARAELDAVYLPPVAAGDVYRLWQRHPRAIGIIDGFFGHMPAVWHKEILWVMEHGVHVFGAAGQGALRAAELDSFGMRGTGWVYQAYRDGTLDRDDEVAVRHAAAGQGYRPLSEAMVNIRRTLQAAQDRDIISAATLDTLTAAAAALFYRDRTWPDLLRAAEAARADPGELDALRRWLPAGQVDQQADDATAMLREMRGFLAADPAPQQVSWKMPDTAMWEVAKHRADAVTRDGEGAAGPPLLAERLLDEIRLLGPEAFDAACCRSLLRVFAADFARREGVTVDRAWLDGAVAEFRTSRDLGQDTELTRFLADSELSAGDLERLIATNEMVRWACGQAEAGALDGFLADLRLSGRYPGLARRARAKLGCDATLGAPAEEQAAVQWYFAERRGTAVPDDLAGYARSCGFGDEQAFRTAVRLEYRYALSEEGHRQ